jgi:hypothetical protein
MQKLTESKQMGMYVSDVACKEQVYSKALDLLYYQGPR